MTCFCVYVCTFLHVAQNTLAGPYQCPRAANILVGAGVFPADLVPAVHGRLIRIQVQVAGM